MQKLLLVSHTHWDREWYLTFEEYRAQLVVTIDKTLDLLDALPEFHSFALDGQTLVIDDYLEIRPESRDRLAAHVRSGRIPAGPQYIIPSAYSLRGEGWVRNFLLGMARCTEFGHTPTLVYMPEPTQLPEQWPQIVRRLGFDTALFGRGASIDPPGGSGEQIEDGEFYWDSAEGSRLFVSHMPLSYEDEHGNRCLLHYCNASDVLWCREYDPLRELPRSVSVENIGDAVHRIGIVRRELSRIATSDTVLLMHGCDHLGPQPDTPLLIEALRPHFDDAHLVQGCFEDYMDAVKTAGNVCDVRTGESRRRGDSHSMVYIRRMDSETQIALIRRMEPAAVFAQLWRGYPEADVLSDAVPDMNCAALRSQAWRYLLQNQAHDTIWGAAIDDVYPEVESRYRKAQQIAAELTGESLFHVAESVATDALPDAADGQYLVACNTLGWTYSGAVETEFWLPADAKLRYLSVTDGSGREWPAQVIESHIAPTRVDRYRRTAYVERRRKVRAVLHVPELPATGYAAVLARPAAAPPVTALRCGETRLENAHIRVDVHADGSFDVTDPRSGRCVSNLNVFVDEGDAGHGWRFARLKNPSEVRSTGLSGKRRLVDAGPVRGTIEVTLQMPLPVGLTRDGTRRRKTLRSCPVRTRISLHMDGRRVEVHTLIDNRVLNHRLRAHFPTGLHADVMQCDGAYAVHERKIRITDPTVRPKGRGIGFTPFPPEETGMMQSWLDISDGAHGFALITRGVPQYEVLNAADGTRTVALTLMRASVGHTHIHDPDLTHGHQCQGVQWAQYAVCIHDGDWRTAGIHMESARYEAPPVFAPTARHGGVRAHSNAWIDALPPEIELAALKPAEDADGIVMRLVNLTRLAVTTTIRFTEPPGRVDRCSLREESEQSLPVSLDGAVDVSFAPMEVLTLRVGSRS